MLSVTGQVAFKESQVEVGLSGSVEFDWELLQWGAEVDGSLRRGSCSGRF